MPSTSMSLRMNESAAAEMTALAAGAGPPANTMATRWMGVIGVGGAGKRAGHDWLLGGAFNFGRQYMATSG